MVLFWNKPSVIIFFLLTFIGLFGTSCQKEKDITKASSLFQGNYAMEPISVQYNPIDDKFYCLDLSPFFSSNLYYRFHKLKLLDYKLQLTHEAPFLYNSDLKGKAESLFSKGCILPGKGFISSGGHNYSPAFQTISYIDNQFKTHWVDSFDNYTLNDIKATSDGGFVVLAGSQPINGYARAIGKLFKYDGKLKLEYSLDLNHYSTYGHLFYPLGISETEKGTFVIGGNCIPKHLLQTLTQCLTNFLYEIDATGTILVGPMLFKTNKIFSYFDPVENCKIFTLPGNRYCMVSRVYNEINTSFDVCVRVIQDDGKTFQEALFGGNEDEKISDAIISNGHLVFVTQSEKSFAGTYKIEMNYAKVDLEDLSLNFYKSFKNYYNDFSNVYSTSICERQGIYYCFARGAFGNLMSWQIDSETGEWKK